MPVLPPASPPSLPLSRLRIGRRGARGRAAVRWLPLLAATALVVTAHGVLLAPGLFLPAQPDTAAAPAVIRVAPVQTRVVPAPVPETPQPASPTPTPAPSPHLDTPAPALHLPVPRPPTPVRSRLSAAAAAAAPTGSASAAETAASAASAAQPAASSAASAPALPDQPSMPAMPASGAAPAAAVPPAVAAMARQPARVPLAYELAYAVTGKRTTWNYHASSRLQWSSDAQGRYRMSFTVSAFLIGSRTQASTGLLTANGLQPDRLSDDWRGGHVTTFVRPADGAQGAGGHIAFSTGRPDAALMPGAQDEVSVFMQLAALLAAHPGLGQPGSTLPIQVAELRGASVWNFGVLPADTVTVDGKPLQTVHLQRAATPDASRTVDVWYAPWKAGSGETVYLPVRLRISEASGDYVEQLLERMPATAP